jgi:2-isopropylmalate synthase
VEQTAIADGPVDAVVKAIDAATGVSVQVRKFEVHSVSVGEDAQGEALLTVEHDGRSYRGSGVSTNIIEAAARSYLEVINRIETTRLTAERTGVERRTIDRSVSSAI